MKEIIGIIILIALFKIITAESDEAKKIRHQEEITALQNKEKIKKQKEDADKWDKLVKEAKQEMINGIHIYKKYNSIIVESKTELSNVFIIVNPAISNPSTSDNGFDIAKKIINAGSFFLTKEGFKFPEKGYVFKVKNNVTIYFSQIINTKTQERFNTDRYVLKSVYIEGFGEIYKGGMSPIGRKIHKVVTFK